MPDASDLIQEITQFLEEVSRTGAGQRLYAERRPAHPGRSRPARGKPASWCLAGSVVAAFAVGGVAVITHLWWLFALCVAAVVAAIPVGKVIGMMDNVVVGRRGPRRRSGATARGGPRSHGGARQPGSVRAQRPGFRGPPTER